MLVFDMSENFAYDTPQEHKLDLMNELKLFIFETFGKEIWIPRSGISKKGNLYLTIIFKYGTDLDIWYSRRKGLEPIV